MNTDKIYAEAIANDYAVKDTSKVVALRKLDRKAKEPAKIFGFTFGIIAALLLGTGMCLVMNQIGDGSRLMHIVGIVVGVIGIIAMSVNYPIYSKILNNNKQKYAGDIIKLASEISNAEE